MELKTKNDIKSNECVILLKILNLTIFPLIKEIAVILILNNKYDS